jgi:hypothetical protein
MKNHLLECIFGICTLAGCVDNINYNGKYLIQDRIVIVDKRDTSTIIDDHLHREHQSALWKNRYTTSHDFSTIFSLEETRNGKTKIIKDKEKFKERFEEITHHITTK